MNDVLFSFIVPVYKVELYLHRCIESLLNQIYENIEIILVDDGSPDRCPEICDEYAAKDVRVKVIHKKNGGLSDARNAGIDLANGDYLIFVDSDDYVENDLCESILEYAQKKYDVLTIDGIIEGTAQGIKHFQDFSAYNSEEYLKKALQSELLPMAAWCYIYRHDFVKENKLKFKVGILHEDEQFTPRALISAKTIINTGAQAYHYVVRNDSITTKKDRRKNLEDMHETVEELKILYLGISDLKLRDLLINSLCKKYLSLFWSCRAYKYGKKYYHKDIVLSCAKMKEERIKAIIFNVSPRLYCYVNDLSKVRKTIRNV